MPESWTTRRARWRFNLYPPYRGSGARVTYIADDWREVRVKVPLNWRSRNYVGTTFGGTLYTAVDPHYMIMLMVNLGRDYVVWDKAATIEFKKPGRGTLYATFRLTQEEIDAVKAAAEGRPSIDRVYGIDLVDGAGVVHATVTKTIYVRRRRPQELAQESRSRYFVHPAGAG